MRKSFYKNIRNSSLIKEFCFVLLLFTCTNCIASEPKKHSAQRDYAFDVSSAFNEYRRHYWHYPDSKESFMAFSENYIAHFWKDLTNKEKKNATWFLFYKNIECKKHNYQIFSLDKYCIFTDFKKRQCFVFSNNLCEDCRLENMSISDFKRHYMVCALDSNNNILWNNSESVNLLYERIQQQINIAYASEEKSEIGGIKMILFKYKSCDKSITFLCELNNNDSLVSNIVSKDIHRLFYDYCACHTDVSEINMYAFIPYGL